MTRQLWRPVNGRTALEFVAGPVGPTPSRPWLPRWQQVAWWAFAVFVLVALACKVVGE